ncbi:MAG: hypothetical protein Q8M92_04775 [Candidatus Subteraquimicrobiales bacterium]|nr:hypothetical protein [Candidatus Subteraquimicrobiales bacterium]
MSEKTGEIYYDRNQLALVCAQMAIKLGYTVRVNIENIDCPIVIIDLPQGQVSYRIPKEDMIGEYPIDYEGVGDGSGLDERSKRLNNFLMEQIVPSLTYTKMRYDKMGE